MEKYLKVEVFDHSEHVKHHKSMFDIENYKSNGLYLVEEIKNNWHLLQVDDGADGRGVYGDWLLKKLFPLYGSEVCKSSKEKTDNLKKELEELKKKYASLESEYKTANVSRERLQKKNDGLRDSSLEACNELGKVQNELETCKIKLKEANENIALAKKSGEEALEKQKAAYETCIRAFREKLVMSEELLEAAKAETKEIKAKYDKDLINLSNSPIQKNGWISSKDLIEILSILKR